MGTVYTVATGSYVALYTPGNAYNITLYCNYGGYTGSQFWAGAGQPTATATTEIAGVVTVASIVANSGGQGSQAWTLPKALTMTLNSNGTLWRWNIQSLPTSSGCMNIVYKSGT